MIPAHILHKELWREDCAFTLLRLDPTYVARIASEIGDSVQIEMLPHLANADPLIHQIGMALKLELESNQPSSRLYVDSLITALAAHLIRHYSTASLEIPASINGLSKHQLERSIAYIHAHLDQEINLAELSAAVEMSKFYFCRSFKYSMGITPYQYVLQQRVERAKQLLKQRRFSVADIALQCGFSNQSHFSRHFKQVVGITPLAFLKQYQERSFV